MNTANIKHFTEILDEELEMIFTAVVIRGTHIEATNDRPRIKEIRKGNNQKSCGKEKYKDREQAKDALWFAKVEQKRAQKEGRVTHRRECRYYFHPGCNAWHLTSKQLLGSTAEYELAS